MALFETPEEKRIREAAEARQKQYEAQTGEQVPEEAGIEPDYTLEDTAMSLMGGGGVAAKAGRYAAGKAKNAVMGKLRTKGAEELQALAKERQQKASLSGIGSGYSKPEYDIKAEPGSITYTKKGKY